MSPCCDSQHRIRLNANQCTFAVYRFDPIAGLIQPGRVFQAEKTNSTFWVDFRSFWTHFGTCLCQTQTGLTLKKTSPMECLIWLLWWFLQIIECTDVNIHTCMVNAPSSSSTTAASHKTFLPRNTPHLEGPGTWIAPALLGLKPNKQIILSAYQGARVSGGLCWGQEWCQINQNQGHALPVLSFKILKPPHHSSFML